MSGQGSYAPINGLQLYFEIHGAPNCSVPPLVLLHGGGDTIETSFGHLIPGLASHRQVIAFEQQGFGHTADIEERPFSFEQSADDTATLLKYLGVEKVDLFGFSNGGTIAYQVALRHPHLVRKIVSAAGFFNHNGSYPEFWEGFSKVQLKDMPQFLQDAYRKTSPHPEKLQSFFDKCVERMRNFQDIPEEVMRGISAPTLVVCGDVDVMRPEHAVETFRILPKAQLAILPGTDHMQLMTRAEYLVPMVQTFLDS